MSAGLSDQFTKLKDNWLSILLVVLLIGFFVFTSPTATFGPISSISKGGAVYNEAGYDSAVRSEYFPPVSVNFAPDVEERKIVQTAIISSEVARGEFLESEQKLKDIVSSSGSFILNENVNSYDSGANTYRQGFYSLRVDVTKYAGVIQQLREIGEIESFSENELDVTGQYVDLETDLETEKARLARYQEILDQNPTVEEKIRLVDLIFNQERRISYLEDAISNIDSRIDYSTISFNLREKQSEFSDIVFVKFSQLVRSLVESINGLLTFISVVVPYSIVLGTVWFGYRSLKKK